MPISRDARPCLRYRLAYIMYCGRLACIRERAPHHAAPLRAMATDDALSTAAFERRSVFYFGS